MFILKSIFWLALVVLMLPAASDGKTPPPRVSLLETVSATRALVADLAGLCARNEAACAIRNETIDLIAGKIRTGAAIAAAMVSAAREGDDISAARQGENRGSLTNEDIKPGWSARSDG